MLIVLYQLLHWLPITAGTAAVPAAVLVAAIADMLVKNPIESTGQFRIQKLKTSRRHNLPAVSLLVVSD